MLARIASFALAALALIGSAQAGQIVAWGADGFGQTSNAPTGAGFVAIAGGEAYGCALAADGSIVAWGYDEESLSNIPVGTGFTAIAAGGRHAYALAGDGSIVAWGRDSESQVSSTPAGTGFTAIAAGYHHGYALAGDGTIVAWGWDSDGQVSNTPTGGGFTAIAGGHFNGYALTADGSISAWGNNDYAQVSTTPAGAGFTAIAAGRFHGFALTADGSIAAWGDACCQISSVPTATGFTAIASGYYHGYALAADGSIAAWGSDSAGQVSDAPTATGFTAISAGGWHGYALLAGTDSTFCDGSDGSLPACPCSNPGTSNTGCDLATGTGGVSLTLLSQSTSPNGAILVGHGYPSMGAPTSIVIRSPALDPASPVVFGDGLRCVGTTGLVRLAPTVAVGGTSTHVFGHSAAAGPGVFYYQLWFRDTPSTYCNPSTAFNLSSGRTLVW